MIAPGSRLLFYSDGLVERKTESFDSGLARLASWAQQLRASPCEEFADQLLDRVYDGDEAADDVALLVVDLVTVRERTADPVERARTGTGNVPSG